MKEIIAAALQVLGLVAIVYFSCIGILSLDPSSSPEMSRLPMQFPLPYTATVIQSGPGIDKPTIRYYVPKEKK